VLGIALVRPGWETLLGTAALAAILLLVSRGFWRPGLWGQVRNNGVVVTTPGCHHPTPSAPDGHS
jgi:hypothetical protein